MRERTGVTHARLDLAAKAAALRQAGLKIREIGEALGVSRSYAGALLTDPDGSQARERKDGYAQSCEICGAPTSGSEGRRPHPRCVDCAAVLVGLQNQVWTPELIIARIREWADLHGEAPAIPDWSPTHARVTLGDEARARRFEDADGHWPWFTIVFNRFGTWNEAMCQAGFEPRSPHGGDGNQYRHRWMRERQVVA